MRYPLAHVTYGHEEIDAVIDTLQSGQTTCGPLVEEFEQAFAKYIGRAHAIMVNSGSSADLLLAFGLGPAGEGDEILVPALTWPTQVWSCLMAGYKVRLVDVDSNTLQFNTNDLESKINARTKAIFPVHVLGNVGDMDWLVKNTPCPIIEDCCEALGSTWRGQSVGTFGQAAAFSFFFSHLINTMEGGMVVTNSPSDARLYRLWRAHGWEPRDGEKFVFPTWGLNVRPTELQGAFGGIQLRRLEEFRSARMYNYSALSAANYRNADYLRGIESLPQCVPVWHGYPIIVSELAPFSRDILRRYLDAHEIETRPIIAGNLARQESFENEARVMSGPLIGADFIHRHGFYIGLASFYDDAGTTYVSNVIDDFMMNY